MKETRSFRRSSRRTLLTLVAAFALLLAACGDSDSNGSGGSSNSGGKDTPSNGGGNDGAVEIGWVNQPSGDATAKEGGVLRFSEASSTLTIDPTTQQSSGASGNIVLGAVYDFLTRYDVDSGTFEPQLAESIESNDDFTEWTVTLREGLEFTDGTPLDADAVVYNFDRYTDVSGATFSGMTSKIDIEAVDDVTIRYSLEEAWATFPALLASTAGNIASPTAIEEHGEDYPNNPVGAGPFKVKSFSPGERIVLERNDDYWDGPASLDEIEITSVGDPAAAVDQLETGQVDLIFTTDAKELDRAQKGDFPGYVAINGAQGFALNTREDAATSDVRVRQAFAHAIDPDLLNDRVDDGLGLYGPSLLWGGSPNATDTPGLEFDLDRAKELVEEAKADGWDGKISILAPQTRNPAIGLTVQAMLNAAGFDAELVNTQSVNELVQRVIVDNNYDAASFGISLWEESPWMQLRAGITLRATGYESEAFQDAVSELGAAGTDEDRAEAFEQIQEQFNEDLPFAVTSAQPMAAMWGEDVAGIVPTSQAAILLHGVHFIEP